MSLVERFKSPTAVKQFLDSPDGMELVKYFTELRDKALKQLRKSNELRDIFYSQGAADAAEKLVTLRNEITTYQDKIASGQIRSGGKENSDGVLEQEQTPGRI